MKVLIVGSGGREHVLAWKLAQSPRVKKIYAAPGNPGVAQHAECLPIKADQIQKIVEWADKEKIDLTVIGPEAPLALGLADALKARGLAVFGPTKAAARLEASKKFAKDMMNKFGVPTGFSATFTDFEAARQYVEKQTMPIVIKADGLAQGKGVTVAQTLDEAEEALQAALMQKVFGIGGETVLIEEFLQGEEVSVLAFVDGTDLRVLPAAQDHKRVFDADQGPNTGGMGAYCPVPLLTAQMTKTVEETILKPMVRGMAEAGCPFQGVLYAGLMITVQGPRVVEFNVRFGDPEAQAIIPLLKTDLAEILMAAVQSRLGHQKVELNFGSCASIVMTSKGYPGSYETGKLIKGIEEAEKLPQIAVFHAGTATINGTLVTAGGRVLAVSAWAETHKKALEQAYQAVAKISFEGSHYRKDIGFRLNK